MTVAPVESLAKKKLHANFVGKDNLTVTTLVSEYIVRDLEVVSATRVTTARDENIGKVLHITALFRDDLLGLGSGKGRIGRREVWVTARVEAEAWNAYTTETESAADVIRVKKFITGN